MRQAGWEAAQVQAPDMIPNRIVIDTNVLLDLFVFRDPRWAALLQAIEEGAVQAMTREDCRCEWEIVLRYPHLPLDEASRAAAQADFARLIQPWQGEAGAHPLPVCKDGDDQKFLELARDCRAVALVTKDKALLKLARWNRRRNLFAIVPPEHWRDGLGG